MQLMKVRMELMRVRLCKSGAVAEVAAVAEAAAVTEVAVASEAVQSGAERCIAGAGSRIAGERSFEEEQL